MAYETLLGLAVVADASARLLALQGVPLAALFRSPLHFEALQLHSTDACVVVVEEVVAALARQAVLKIKGLSPPVFVVAPLLPAAAAAAAAAAADSFLDYDAL